MVRLSGLPGPLLLDMRGFFADERVDAASWAAGSLLDRAVRAMERQNLKRAARVVVLTNRGRGLLRARGVSLPIDVIPTCVDLEQFTTPAGRTEATFDLVYFGSLGGWYMTEEMLEFVLETRRRGDPIRVLFLTNNVDAALKPRLQNAGVTVRTALPEEVPEWLARCRSTFFFIRATPSKLASCPTKLAEALAMGLPVLTGPGVGDVDEILTGERVGVVLDDFSKESFWLGWKALTHLLADPQTPNRCRSVAERRLSLSHAVDLYESAYRSVTSGIG
jgi:glycosyltransferase involved in cell wall biosynthesis